MTNQTQRRNREERTNSFVKHARQAKEENSSFAENTYWYDDCFCRSSVSYIYVCRR